MTRSSPFSDASDSSSSHGARPSVAVAIDRRLIRSRGGSVRYLTTTITAPRPAPREAATPLPLNLALVIDASGSMSGAPIEAAKSAVLKAIDRLSDLDHLSVVSFAEDVVLHVENMAMTAEGKVRAKLAVHELQPRGSTNLGAGWLLGCEAAAKRRASVLAVERDHVVVLSDGHANAGIVDPVELARLAADLRERGITTSTVGIGCRYSPVQLQVLAESGGGRMHDAERPDEIAEIVLAELLDAESTTMQNVELHLHLPPRVRAEVFGTARASFANGTYRVVIGAITAGVSRRVVVKLRFEGGSEGETVALSGVLSWLDPATAMVQELEWSCGEVQFADGASCANQQRDPVVAELVLDQWQAHIVQEAMARNQAGDLDAAHRYVHEQLVYFASYCDGIPRGPQLLLTLRAFARSMQARYEPARAKEMMLGSYKMGRGEEDRRRDKRFGFSTYMEDQLPPDSLA
ncbi:MAG: VWA domain-containing protein [Planctomycetota bacterium]